MNMSLTLTIGAPPAGVSESKVLASLTLVGECYNALPFGKIALSKLGGVEQAAGGKKKNPNEFPDELIKIPVGVTPQNLKKFTLYDMLGLGSEWGDSADTEAIKKCYHKAVLMYHPDKAQFKTSDGKEDRTVFLKIQEAMNVLSNEQKRRAYDSQLPFDESIPVEAVVVEKMGRKGPKSFFKLFSPVFKRNGRFSIKKPVPDLGDMETSLPQVKKFYSFWVGFESWRDFTGVGAEHKPDDAGSREEKRWMEKENAKIAKKKKAEEMERIINLVMLAQKLDPRLVAEKNEKKNAKEAEKNAKEAEAKRRVDELNASRAWLEQQEIAANAPLTKDEKEKLKKKTSAARNTLRKLLRQSAEKLGAADSLGEYGVISEKDVELICSICDLDDLNEMNKAMGGDAAVKDPSAFVLEGAKSCVIAKRDFVAGIQSRDQEDDRIAKDIKKREQEERGSPKKANKPDREWTSEDISIIMDACNSYKPGTSNRIDKIYCYVNSKISSTELISHDEIIVQAYKAFVTA